MVAQVTAAGRTPYVIVGRHVAGGGGRWPRVLLLHGMASNSKVWDPLLALAPAFGGLRGADFWCAELPWRGDGPGDWSQHTDTTAWLEEALRVMAANAGAAELVVAHSYSATLLLDLVASRPEVLDQCGIRGLVLVSPFFRPRPRDFSWDEIARLSDRFVATMEEGIRVIAGDRSNTALRPAMAKWVCETIGPYGWFRFLELYLRTPWMQATAVRRPALVVSGTGDLISPPLDSRALVARLPAAELRSVTLCGHFPMIEQAGAFAGLLDTFLKDWSPPE